MSNSLIIIVVIAAFVMGLFVEVVIDNYPRDRIRTNQNRGESNVHRVVKLNFLPPQYYLLNNVTLPLQVGTTQVDHILISTKGIFVIETKNYSGWIFGDEISKQWVQVLYRIKSKFQNPIHQNYLHLKTIESLLDFLPKEQIHSIVVFTGSAEFKTPIPKGVVYIHQLNEYLRTFQDDVISINRVEFCVGRLECKRYEMSKMTDIQHQAYLAQKFNKPGD